MQAIDLVRFALGCGDHVFNGLVKDLRDHPMTTQSSTGGNHAVWTLGHIALWEGRIPGIVDGSPNPLAKWEDLFKTGSKPMSDPKAYPSFDELLASYQAQRANLMTLVEQTGEAQLGETPAHLPKGFESVMATKGQMFLLMAMHQMQHAGELADIRRVVGLKPIN